MIFSNKLIYILLGVLSIFVGIKIVYTKKIGQGNASMGGESIFIGNMAYGLGAIFIFLGLYIFYSILKQKKE